MNKIAILYSPTGGATEKVARKIAKIAGEKRCDLLPVNEDSINQLNNYENIIFGLSTIGKETWNSDPVVSGWFRFIHDLSEARLDKKTIAIFGLGDQIRYPDNFVDAIGELYRVIIKSGGDTIGKVDPSEYDFNHSQAIIDGKFAGLPVDEEFESEFTDRRIVSWVETILPQFS